MILDFNEAIDGGVAVASDGPYANHLHLVPDMCEPEPPIHAHRTKTEATV